MSKKSKGKYNPRQQTSVAVRPKPKSTPFKDALNGVSKKQMGRPASKLQQITDALGDEYHLFVEACCNRKVTTMTLTQAIKDFGIAVSYGSMLKIRKQMEAENQWFYEMVQDITSGKSTGIKPSAGDSYNDDAYWSMESPIEQ